MQVELGQDLRRVVGHLRAEYGYGVPVSAVVGVDHQRVAHVLGHRRQALEDGQRGRVRLGESAVGGGAGRAAGDGHAVVGQGGGGRVDPARLLVREALGRRGGRGRVVGPAQVGEALIAAGGAQLPAQVLQQVRVGHFAATAPAEDAADEPGDGDHVADRPLLRDHRRHRGEVVGRQQRRVGHGGRDVAVHAGDVVLDHRLGQRALRAVLGWQRVDLGLGLRRRVGREQQLVVVHLLELTRPTEEGREGTLAVVTQHVHEEQPVLGLRVAGTVRQGLIGVAVDVRHVVGVAVDADARLRLLDALDVRGRHAERLVVVEVAQRGVGERRLAVEEVLVLAQLVLAGRRPRAGGREQGRVQGVDQPVLARRQDAHGLPVGVVVGPVGVRRRAAGGSRPRTPDRARCGGGQHDHRCHRHEAAQRIRHGLSPPVTPCSDPGTVRRGRPVDREQPRRRSPASGWVWT